VLPASIISVDFDTGTDSTLITRVSLRGPLLEIHLVPGYVLIHEVCMSLGFNSQVFVPAVVSYGSTHHVKNNAILRVPLLELSQLLDLEAAVCDP
jgi:hypothetical protein